MHWEILIIPLIALGVWILGTLFKTGEDDKMKKGVRRPGGVPGRGSARRPVTDLDRFLEEARRRREAEERPWQPSAPAPARPTRPPRVATPVIRRAEVPIAAPVVPAVVQPARVEPVPVAAPIREALPPPTPRPREAPLSPVLQQVRSLLSKPQTAGAAFVLREIFDRPLSMRRR